MHNKDRFFFPLGNFLFSVQERQAAVGVCTCTGVLAFSSHCGRAAAVCHIVLTSPLCFKITVNSASALFEVNVFTEPRGMLAMDGSL